MAAKIWTLAARSNAMLDAMADYFSLTPESMYNEIRGAHETTVEILAAKGIQYDSLRAALTPDRKKREYAFVFDSTAAANGGYNYGAPIHDALLPLLPKDLTCALLTGDLIISDQSLGFELLRRGLELHKPVRMLRDTSELYAVYINSLTPSRSEEIHQGLMRYEPYVGRIPATYSSLTKDWLATTLGTRYVKAARVFIGPHEDDAPNDKNYNLPGWSIEEEGFSCVSIQSMYFDLFLNYKIERRTLPGETDTKYSLNSISTVPAKLTDLGIELDDRKLAYVSGHRGGGFGAAGLVAKSREEVTRLIQERISRNYIYAMELKEHTSGVAMLFSIMLEFPRPIGHPVRMTAVLEYVPSRNALRLVTLY